MRQERPSQIVHFPLYPQYATSTSLSVIERVQSAVDALPYSPDFQTVTEHHDDAALSAVWARRLNEHDWQNFDLVLFSYHGLPIRQVIGASQQSACARSSQCANCSCLEVWNEANRLCYQASCMNTSRRIAQELGLPEDRWRMSFQSSLGHTSSWLLNK